MINKTKVIKMYLKMKRRPSSVYMSIKFYIKFIQKMSTKVDLIMDKHHFHVD